MSATKRLYRSRSNRMLTGVCGGVAQFLGIDATIVRILALIIPGINLVTYIILTVIIPEE